MLRASAALHIPTAELFRPLIPVQVVGLAFVFDRGYMLGKREERRLGIVGTRGRCRCASRMLHRRAAGAAAARPLLDQCRC